MDQKSFKESLDGMSLDEMIAILADAKLLPLMKCIVLDKIAEQMEMDKLMTNAIRKELKRRGYNENNRVKPTISTDSEVAQ